MLINSVAVLPLSMTAMFPQGSLMFGPAHAVTSRPLLSSTSRQPFPFVFVVPSVLGVLPTTIQPLLSMVMAVVNPTPPGHWARCCGNLANSVAFLVDGL